MENLENLSLADLRAYAKKLRMKGVSTLRKKELAQRLSQEQQKHTMSEAPASIEKQSHDEKKERRQNETAPRRDGREFRREYNQKVKAHYNNKRNQRNNKRSRYHNNYPFDGFKHLLHIICLPLL